MGKKLNLAENGTFWVHFEPLCNAMPNKKAQEFACLPRVLKRAALNENPIQKITLLGRNSKRDERSVGLKLYIIMKWHIGYKLRCTKDLKSSDEV